MAAYPAATSPPSPPPFLLLLLLLLLVLTPPALSQTVVVTVEPTIPTSAPEFVDDATFTSAVLNSTNAYRASHGASAVRWNATLAAYAAAYLGRTCALAHSGGPYGENLALGCANATSCVEAWGDEGRAYDFGDPGFAEATGHFSQLVWRNTTDVGCGRRLCAGAGWYLVCEYWPRGNVVGSFAAMVGAPENAAAAAAGARPGRLGWGVVVVVMGLFRGRGVRRGGDGGGGGC